MPELTFDSAYYNGGRSYGYGLYSRELWGSNATFPDFAAELLNKAASRGLSLAQRTVLVVGCAYGYTVEALRALGVDAYGMDVSAYAVSQAPAAVAPYVIQGDVLTDLDAARDLAGLKGRRTFDFLLDEDVLTCLDDAQAVTACAEFRRVAARVGHRLTVHPVEGYNTKPLADWRALCDPTGRDWWWVYMTWGEG